MEHKVVDVYVNDQGAVVGAKVQKPDGSIMNVKANKGVVLARPVVGKQIPNSDA